MEEIIKIVGLVGLIVAIATGVAAVVCHFLAIQLNTSREEMRALRVALEKEPSPAQLGEALRLWPEATKYNGGMQLAELRKGAHGQELIRAERTEKLKGLVRVLFFIAVIGIVLFIAGQVLAGRV